MRVSDGGRKAAGFKVKAGDCACRAVAIATGKPYREIYDLINEVAKAEGKPKKKRKGKGVSSARSGVYRETMDLIMASLGWSWVPTMKVGQGCKVHLRADELPSGRIVVRLSRHYAAVIDGILHDDHDSSRGGTRCVYGYWKEI